MNVVESVPVAEFPARREAMQALGMTTWVVGYTQVARWAGAEGYLGWLRDQGYDPATCEVVHAQEIDRDVVLLLGAWRRGGSA